MLEHFMEQEIERLRAELSQAQTERDAFANVFGGGNIVLAMVNCRADRARIAEQARQLEEARQFAQYVCDNEPSAEHIYILARAWLAANAPAPQAEQEHHITAGDVARAAEEAWSNVVNSRDAATLDEWHERT